MEIAVFIKSTTFHRGFGGLETQNKALCEGLARKGYEITVFSPKQDLSLDNQILNGVSYVFVDSKYSLGGNWRDRSFSSFIEKHKEKSFDLVISQSSAGVGIIRRKRELGVKVISIAHGSILGEYKTTLQNIRNLRDFIKLIPDTLFVLRVFFGRQREFILGSDAVIAVSKFVKKALVKETGVLEEKVTPIHNGIDPSLYKMGFRKSDNNIVRVVYTGQIIRSKGIDFLLRILTDEKFLNVDLTVAGDGNYLNDVKNLMEKLGLEKRVTFLGKLEASGVAKVLMNSDIFVFPSKRAEGFPMVLVEAMFAGLPIVAFDVGGVSEAVADGETGFLCKPGNAKDFKNRLEKLVLEKDLRAKFGLNALARAGNEFSLDVMLDKYESVFREVMK